jgi:hypothetical protein
MPKNPAFWFHQEGKGFRSLDAWMSRRREDAHRAGGTGAAERGAATLPVGAAAEACWRGAQDWGKTMLRSRG